MTSRRPLAVVILAAGQGTRMRSDLHKVLHPIAGRPMLLHLLGSVDQIEPDRVVVVVGARADQVAAAVTERAVTIVHQHEQLGTGHAVLQARAALAGFDGDLLVLFGDGPLIRAETMARLIARLDAKDAPGVVVLGFRPDDPAAYGRILTSDDGGAGDRIERMVEYKDASADERAVTLCNAGPMAGRADALLGWLDRVGCDNAAGEYYLPDVVALAQGEERIAAVVEAPAAEVAGVNSRAELAMVEALWQDERRARAMAEGATLMAPDTVWFAWDTQIGSDVTIEPHVVFGPGVTIADGATIRAFSHIAGARVAHGAQVGPFARLRPGSHVGEGSKIGNFVEVKNAHIGDRAAVSHLSYIGDAEIGAEANIGAGTITCNYDGFLKYRTRIGAGAFVGSNSALVAPVSIGAGAIVGAGSVVTRDVAADSLMLTRAEAQEKSGWARRFREQMRARRKG